MKYYHFEHRINILGRILYKKLFEKISYAGLTSSQWTIISFLFFYGETTQAKIADQLALEPPTVSKALYNLELAGWIIRIVDKNDKREKKAVLSDNAKKTIPGLLKSIDEFQGEVINDISAPDIEAFDRVLTKIYKNVSKKSILKANQ